MPQDLHITKPVAPEDLRPGMYLAHLTVMTEHLPFSALCGEDAPWQRRGLVRTQWLPFRNPGAPMKVVEVCLPFVLVARADGTHDTLDVRRCTLGRLAERYGRRAFKKLKSEAGKTD